MRRHTRIMSSAAALVAGVVFGVPPARPDENAAPVEEPRAGATAPALAGRWRLDPERSDDARQKMREAGSGRRGGAPGGGPMGGPGGGGMGRPPGGGPPGGGGGGRGPGPGGDDPREAMRAILEPAAEIQITPTEREIAILEKDGRLRTLHPDGKKYKAEAGRTEVKTRWEGAELVVETQTAMGGRTTETFAVAPAEKTLTITVRIEGTPMPALTLKRVYHLTDTSAE